ncbi:MAG: sugar ABC transporter substrate-binding protein [Patescibacteria group bacterium]|nr:sugar ABC transporter substrate-binding protein [Patescibacteria group bacterium]MCX7589615.1 sugar ABC transporter substrate-binding protein [Patescibacteria group bacterium]MDW8279614.1 sugar ABC transporter substrate-binding protein [bacterium]
MNFSRNQIIIIGLFLIIVIFGLIFYFGRRPAPLPQIELTIWGVEPEKNFDELFKTYKQLRPNVKINYEQINSNDYRQKLIDALASGYGPDIFMIKSKSLLQDISKIYPVLDNQFNLSQFKSIFPQVVEDDFVYNGKIYALPLYIDSLVLFYNQDYFNKAQLIYPPKTWDEFVEYAKKLTIFDLNNSIAQAGAALGASQKNVVYANDILKLLMKQAGIPIFNVSKFDLGLKDKNSISEQILNFYLSFSDSKTSNYTWPRNFDNSINAFASGKVAMIFAYQKDIDEILKRNPYLNFKIAPVPQFKNASINYAYADYWALTVSNQSKNPTWAWDFIIYSTTYDALNQKYLTNSKKPPATKSQIAKYISDLNLGVFASQALISRSWQEPNIENFNKILNNIIEDILNNKINVSDGLRLIEEQSNQLIKNY